jgi:DNA-binding response OmpR family regulator
MIRILAVDDEPAICSLIKHGLEKKNGNYQVDVAYDGQQAMKAHEQKQYDLMILDLVMPVMSGTEVLAQRDKYPACRVLILTAYGSFDTAVQALRNDVDDYLSKPVSLAQLSDAVYKSVGVKRFAGIEARTEGNAVLAFGVPLDITERLRQILLLFLSDPKATYNYEELLQALDGQKVDRPTATNALSAHMSRLRTLLRDATGVEMIEAQKGLGFGWTHGAWRLERGASSSNR